MKNADKKNKKQQVDDKNVDAHGKDDKDAGARAKEILDSGNEERIQQALDGELGPEVQAEVERRRGDSGHEGGDADGEEAAEVEAEEGGDNDNREGEGEEGDEEGQGDGEGEAEDQDLGQGVDSGEAERVGDAPEASDMGGKWGGGGSDGAGAGGSFDAAPMSGAGGAAPAGGGNSSGGACDLGPVSPLVLPNYSLHKVWAETPPWDGAGDYSKYGEPGSVMRRDAVLSAVCDGGMEGLVGKPWDEFDFGEYAYDKLKSRVSDVGGILTGVAGDIKSIGEGLDGLTSFNYREFVERAAGLFDLETWDDDPFGQAANFARFIADQFKLIQELARFVGGVANTAGNLLAPLKVAGGILGVAEKMAGITNAEWLIAAATARSLSVLSADADSRLLNKSLKELQEEVKGGTSGMVDLLKLGAEKGGTKGLSDDNRDLIADAVGGPSAWGVGHFRSVAERYIAQFGDPELDKEAMSKPAYWSAAHTRADELRNTGLGLNLGAAGVISLACPPLGLVVLTLGTSVNLSSDVGTATFDLLPEAPHDIDDLCQERARAEQLKAERVRLHKLTPQIGASQERAKQEKQGAAEVEASGVNLADQMEHASGNLDNKEEKHAKASADVEKLNSSRQKANENSPRADILEKMRWVVATIDKAPDIVVPDSVEVALKNIRPALGMKHPNAEVGKVDDESAVGAERVKQTGEEIAGGRQHVDGLRSVGQSKAEQANAHGQTLVDVERRLEKAKCDADAYDKALEQSIQQLERDVEQKESALEGWATVHSGVAKENDDTAAVVLEDAEVEDGEVVGLSSSQQESVEAAKEDLKRCRSYLLETNRATQSLVHDQGLSNWLQEHNLHAIIDEGIEDCDACAEALTDVDPDTFHELVGEAYDTTGRIRDRLKALPPKPEKCEDPPPKKDEECEGEECEEPPPEEKGGEVADNPDPEPEPVDIGGPFTVGFEQNLPLPASPRDRGALRPDGVNALDTLIKTLSADDLEGGRMSAVGHASVEAPAAYNQRLSVRRAGLVKAEVEGKTGAQVATSGVGESQAGEAKGRSDKGEGERYEHKKWRKVVVTVVEKPVRKVKEAS